MSTRKIIIPAGLEEVYDIWHYAPAIISGGKIYCSGIVGVRGEEPAADPLAGARSTLKDKHARLSALRAVEDPEQQFAVAFETLAVILDAAGAGLADIVELTSYHVDMHVHMETFMRVRDRYLGEPWPAWTAIGVQELIVPGGLVELRAIASAP